MCARFSGGRGGEGVGMWGQVKGVGMGRAGARRGGGACVGGDQCGWSKACLVDKLRKAGLYMRMKYCSVFYRSRLTNLENELITKG